MKARASTKHPYLAIEHRVIDSPAYADLTFSARSMLLQIARQLTKNNNGFLQATYSDMRRFGFDSEHTISRAIKDLIAHGMIYRTRAGGYHLGAAQYAITWLPIKAGKGLFLDGFKLCAWRDWKPEEKNLPPEKVQPINCKNGMLTQSTTAKNAPGYPPKSADTELIPIEVGLFIGAAQTKSTRACANIFRMPQIAGGRLEPMQTFH